MTSKASTLLESLDLPHPTARALVEAARDHGAREGDGSAALILMASAAFLASESQLRQLHFEGVHGRATAAHLATVLRLLAENWLPAALDHVFAPAALRVPLTPGPALSAAVAALVATTLQHKHDAPTSETLVRLVPQLVLSELFPQGGGSVLASLDRLADLPPIALLPGAPISQSGLSQGVLIDGKVLPKDLLQTAAANPAGRGRTLLRNCTLLVVAGLLDPLTTSTPSGIVFRQSDADRALDSGLDILQWRREVFLQSLRALASDSSASATRPALLLVTADRIPPDLVPCISDVPGLTILHECDAQDVQRLCAVTQIAPVSASAFFAQSVRVPSTDEKLEGTAASSRAAAFASCADLQLIATSPTTYRALFQGLQGPGGGGAPSSCTLLLRCPSTEVGQQILQVVRRALRTLRQAAVQQTTDGTWALELAPAAMTAEAGLWILSSIAAENVAKSLPVTPPCPPFKGIQLQAVAAGFSVIAAAAARPLSILFANGSLADLGGAASTVPTAQRRVFLCFAALRRRLLEEQQQKQQQQQQKQQQWQQDLETSAPWRPALGVVSPWAARESARLLLPTHVHVPGASLSPAAVAAAAAAQPSSAAADRIVAGTLIVASPLAWSLVEPAGAALRRVRGALSIVAAMLRTDLLVSVSQEAPEGRVMAARRTVGMRAGRGGGRAGDESEEEDIGDDSSGSDSD